MLNVTSPTRVFHWIIAILIALIVNALIALLLGQLGLSSLVTMEMSAPPRVVVVSPEMPEVMLTSTGGGGAGGGAAAIFTADEPQSMQAPDITPAEVMEESAIEPLELPLSVVAPRIEPIRVAVETPRSTPTPQPEKPANKPAPKKLTDQQRRQLLDELMGGAKPAKSTGGKSGGGLGGADGAIGAGLGGGKGAGTGSGTGSGTGGPEELGQMPRAIYEPKPRYPLTALRRGIEGYVTVKLLINEQGRVQEVKILDWRGDESFVDAVMEGVRQYRYEPMMRGGKPMSFWGTRQIRFKIER